MQPTATLAALFLFSLAVTGAPIYKREVPQEHSHEQFLTSVRSSLALNNPAGIKDPVFGLLGNAAASQGQGSISDTSCLHQATADQAFTNAKAAGDVTGMVNALIYAALERNTGKVGLASALCTSIKAVNPEIAAISQHQDPASPGAAATNKAITLELAKQIASVGGDPQQALKSGTFAPGNLSDNTGKGNTCDTAGNNGEGCIFTENLLVPDATAQEIGAAVAGITSGAATANNTAGNSATSAAGNSSVSSNSTGATSNDTATASNVTATVSNDAATASNATLTAIDATATSNTTAAAAISANTTSDTKKTGGHSKHKKHDKSRKKHGAGLTNADKAAGTTANTTNTVSAASTADSATVSNTNNATAANASTLTDAAAGSLNTTSNGTSSSSPCSTAGNLQTFSGSLGGISAPAVTASGNQVCVAGNSCFASKASALQRSCDVQHNKCADASNAAGQAATFSIADCGQQQTQCNAQAASSA